MTDTPTPREGLVVLGLPRSGTTLLQRLLGGHRDIAAPPESYVLRGGARFLTAEPMSEGLRMGPISGLAFAGFSEDEVLHRTREFCLSFLREYAARQEKRMWLEKTAHNVFNVPGIEQLCGEAVGYLCILRHPVDVVLSLQDLLIYTQRFPDELHAFMRAEPNLLHALARAWVHGTQTMLDLAARRPEQTFVLRYEDLVAEPDATLGPLCAHFGLGWDTEAVTRSMEDRSTVGFGDWKVMERSKVDQSSVGRWKRVSKHTLSDLGAIVNETAVRAGYEPLKRLTGPSPEEARRQLELAHMLSAMKHRDAEGK